MAYTSWSVVFGEQPSSAKWNILGTNDASFHDGTGIANQEVGNVTAVKNDYKFSAWRTGALNITTTGVTVPFDTEVFDTTSNFNNSTGTFTAPIAGFYLFCCSVEIAATGSVTALQTELQVGGVTKYRFPRMGNAGALSVGSGGAILYQASINDAFTILCTTAGATAAVNNSQARTWFTGCYISTT